MRFHLSNHRSQLTTCSLKVSNVEITKAVVKKFVTLNYTNKYAESTVILDAKHGKINTFLYLKVLGADINIFCSKNITAVHLGHGRLVYCQVTTR